MKLLRSLLIVFIPALLFSACVPKPIIQGPVSPTSQLSVVYACTPAATSQLLVYNTGRVLFSTTNDGSEINHGTGNIVSGSNVQLRFFLNYDTLAVNLLYSNSFKLVADSNYSLLFGGSATNPCHLFVQNDMSAPAAGMAKVRFVILSSDTSQFNCFDGATQLYSGLTYQSVTPFIEVPADSFASFTFVNAAIPAVQISTGKFLLGPGGICTIVLGGKNGVENFSLITKIITLNSSVVL